MLALASDPDKRHQLGLAARARAQQFDWKRSATSMLAIYEKAIRAPKRTNMKQTASDSTDTLRSRM
jgi:hypothetical protein